MTKVGIEYLKFYNRIGGRINKKGNFQPFKPKEHWDKANDKIPGVIIRKGVSRMNKLTPFCRNILVTKEG
jgi:hypothetical protein